MMLERLSLFFANLIGPALQVFRTSHRLRTAGLLGVHWTSGNRTG